MGWGAEDPRSGLGSGAVEYNPERTIVHFGSGPEAVWWAKPADEDRGRMKDEAGRLEP